MILVAMLCVALGLPPRVGATVYDFSTGAGSDRFAFQDSVPELPIPPVANDVPSLAVPASAYGALAFSDDVRHETAVVEGGNFAATRFVFLIAEPATTVTQIDVGWEGGANEDLPQSLWLWNAVSGSYVLVGGQQAKPPPDGTVTGSFTANASEFVDADGAVVLLAHYGDNGGMLVTDYVSVTVTRTAACGGDVDCDDGLFCNGAETCDPVAGCLSGAPVDCDDGLVCTLDTCNDATATCDHAVTDCDDGLFCTGIEICDPVLGCQSGTPVDCNDAVACTTDLCNEATTSCDHVPDHVRCGNGVFCDGDEACSPVAGCQPGLPFDCDDGLVCTTDSCNEITASCDNVPSDPTCIVPSRWYVDANATGVGDGTSWADALPSLQDALAAAVYGDDIWVAAGTYKADQGVAEIPGDMSAAFQLRNGVAVYGHFLGNESTLAERDLTDLADPLRQSVLSGDIGVIGYQLDNSRHVVTGGGTDGTALLDGFTVTEGVAPKFGLPAALGGGLQIADGSPTIVNCTFTGNDAGGGGGVGNYLGSPTFIGCSFTANSADIGGGFYNLSGSPILTDCTFTDNVGDEQAGGMAEMYGTSQLTNCLFTGNSTIAQFGGGLYVYLAPSHPTLTNCTFTDNSANYGGGGVYDRGGVPTVVNSVFWGNTATFAGTIESAQIGGNAPQISHSAVQGWTGVWGGAGNTGGDPLFANPLAGDYRLLSGSACIDAADNTAVPAEITSDLDGRPRFMDDPATPDTGAGQAPIADMGAYEYGAPCLADVDCDDGEVCNGNETCAATGFCQSGTPIGCAPQLSADPISLDLTLAPGQVATTPVTLTNNGTAATAWHALTVQGAAANQAATPPTPGGEPVPAVDWTAPHEPNTLLVAFKSAGGQLSTAQRMGIHAACGTTKIHSCDTIPVDLVEVPVGADLQATAAEYAALPEVDYVEPNFIVNVNAVPNDPSFGTLWGLHNTGQVGGTVDADIDAPEAWNAATGSQAVVVAVIDTGIDYTHPELAPNMWANDAELTGLAGFDDDGNGIVDDVHGARWTNGFGTPTSGDPYDDHFHGTHVAGTIGAVGNDGVGVVGVSWNVRLMALKFLNAAGSGYTSDAISAVEYAAAKGAHISNNSWGGGAYSQALKNAIDAAGAAGHLFVAAAGNNSRNTDTFPAYPASYSSATILSVAATDRNDQRSSFSNYGSITVDLGAPGSDILSTSPGGGYRTLNGTSMASPHVSGVAALVLGVNPALSALDLKQTIMDSVDPIPALTGLTVTGGRLNAATAVAAVPWLTVIPVAGTLAPGASVILDVVADATNLALGFVDNGSISIASDDPAGPANVSVGLTVAFCTVDADCDDGLTCNGVETCDPAAGCQAGTPLCDDGVLCTVDSCDEATAACTSVPTDAVCDNGVFCDGAEICDAVLDCQTGTPVVCDDGVGCTVDACDEAAASCGHAPDHGACSNGLFCDGTETCDLALGCQGGTALDCSGLTDQCNVGSCSDAVGDCVVDPVPDGTTCDNGDTCAGDVCQAGICAPATCGAPPPAPPQNLKGGIEKAVEIEWEPSPGPNLAGYNVYRAPTAGGPYTQLAGVGPITTGYQDAPAPGSYCYVVTAVNTSGGESANSNEVCGVVIAEG